MAACCPIFCAMTNHVSSTLDGVKTSRLIAACAIIACAVVVSPSLVGAQTLQTLDAFVSTRFNWLEPTTLEIIP